MDIWSRFRSKPVQNTPDKAAEIMNSYTPTESQSEDDNNYWNTVNQYHDPKRPDGWPPDISMLKLMHVGTSSPLLKSTLDTFITYSIGSYFDVKIDAIDSVEHPASDKQVTKARDAIQKFMRSFNLHAWNRSVARSLWLTGNCFFLPLKYEHPKKYSGLTLIPLTAFEGIRLDAMGMPAAYVKQASRYDGLLHKMGIISNGSYNAMAYHSTGKIDVQAYNGHKGLIHVSRGNIDASPWGEGLGQIMCRTGAPYIGADGTAIYRPALYKAESMIAHVLWQILYGGTGRYAVFVDDHNLQPDQVENMRKNLNQTKPNQHFVVNAKGTVQTLSYGATGKYEPIIEDLKNRITLALGNPMIKLLGDQSFAYASSETAAKSMIPLIAGYEHDHTHILETYVLKPIIKATFPAKPDMWDKLDIKVIWGDPNAKKIDEVKTAIDALHGIKEYDLDAPRHWINNAGFPLPEMTEEQKKEKEENKKNMLTQMQGNDNNDTNQPPQQTPQQQQAQQQVINMIDRMVRNSVKQYTSDEMRQMDIRIMRKLEKHLDDD